MIVSKKPYEGPNIYDAIYDATTTYMIGYRCDCDNHNNRYVVISLSDGMLYNAQDKAGIVQWANNEEMVPVVKGKVINLREYQKL